MITSPQHWNAILSEFHQFSPHLRHVGATITDNRLEAFESKIGYILPEEFKWLLKGHNGISLMGTEVLGLDSSLRGSSLDEVYHIEHFEVGSPMPLHFLPFSPDGRGNHYCLNLDKLLGQECPVIFWQHDFFYDDLNQVKQCHPNLFSWIQEVMIDWTLNSFNYDGIEKG